MTDSNPSNSAGVKVLRSTEQIELPISQRVSVVKFGRLIGQKHCPHSARGGDRKRTPQRRPRARGCLGHGRHD